MFFILWKSFQVGKKTTKHTEIIIKKQKITRKMSFYFLLDEGGGHFYKNRRERGNKEMLRVICSFFCQLEDVSEAKNKKTANSQHCRVNLKYKFTFFENLSN